jgi:hypothetical protein
VLETFRRGKTGLERLFFSIVICLPGLLPMSLLCSAQKNVRADKAERTKIAEGEYAVYEEANGRSVGSFGEEVYDFRESWTLWKDVGGEYEIEGQRQFESPRDLLRSHRFAVRLSRDLTMLQATEYAELRWAKDSGPFTCVFLSRELHCSSVAEDPRKAINERVPMSTPYGLLWPISPFSIGGLAKEEERNLSRSNPASLVSIRQPSAKNPIEFLVMSGELRYLGIEDLETAGQRWQAYKFSLKVALQPKYLIWTSSNGLLLVLSVQSGRDWPKEGMRLTRFVKSGDF